MTLTNSDKELIEIIAGLVDELLPDVDGDMDYKHSRYLRINKTAMEKLVELGLMVEVYPDAHQSDSPFKGYDARFVPDWRRKLWTEL